MRRLVTQFLLEEGRVLVAASVGSELSSTKARAGGTQLDEWHPAKGVSIQRHAAAYSLQVGHLSL